MQENTTTICKCGCGGQIVRSSNGSGFLKNHNQHKSNNQCKCGCGAFVSFRSKTGYVNHAHSYIGKKFGPLSEERKKNISLSKMGSTPWNKGKKRPAFSEEWLKNISEAGKGKIPWNKGKKMPSSCTGPNHPNWKGGITPKNVVERRSTRYREWAKAVKIRDDFTCQHCGVRGGKLHSDHIKGFADYPDLRYELSNGRTLCIPCHEKTPNYKNRKAK